MRACVCVCIIVETICAFPAGGKTVTTAPERVSPSRAREPFTTGRGGRLLRRCGDHAAIAASISMYRAAAVVLRAWCIRRPIVVICKE